ncbi:glycoside hydrolase [Fodinicola feengrottensis]|uniref:Endo-beta-1,6-galactanase-like domain-containing protein n=1 Tax=Fodinicola feengrottensis TaxID=435914 RepID=A0ABN2FTM3_9ACTN|nr:glycoside hydrolase [Fodinicola feengrottensis]
MDRRTFLASSSAAALSVLVPPVSTEADMSVAIDPKTTWCVWEGWGTSLCWWGKAYGTRDDLADLLFTTNQVSYEGNLFPGLGLTVVRYNAGACTAAKTSDGSTMVPSSNIPASRQMEGYWLDWTSADPSSASWNWLADAGQRAIMGKARDRGATTFELFSNSPMWWMCYNHNPSGSPIGITDNLQSWNYQQHAVYLATVAKYAHDHWGIDFASVEPFNEPAAPWWTAFGTQEGCHFGASTQQTVVGGLRRELDSRGLTSTMVAASDENTYDQARATWGGFSSQAKGSVGRVNVHGYQQGGGRRDLLYNDVVVAAGKKLWNSEYGENDATGLSMASNINLDMYWLHPSAWVYWQVLDGSDWGLLDADETAGTVGTVRRKFYVLAHYSRHIRPGMQVIRSADPNTVAAYDQATRKLVLVTANLGTAQWVSYDLSAFGTVVGDLGQVRRWVTQTDGGDAYQAYSDTSLSGKGFRCWFGTNTVQTFEIDNVLR